MSIPEEDIVGHLNWLLEQADPGDVMHHLVVVAAGGLGPLGIPDAENLAASVHAIAPVGKGDVRQFIARTIVGVGVEYAAKGRPIMFAALSQEVLIVEGMDAEADRLLAEGRLDEHPDVREVTLVYGACRDGRRWRSQRWLTGPKVGQTEDVELLVGRLDPQEVGGVAGLVRRLVGLR